MSGDVIEYTGPPITGTFVLTGGSSLWTQNVLIRPPLGSRQSGSGITITARNVTVAGFDWTGGA